MAIAIGAVDAATPRHASGGIDGLVAEPDDDGVESRRLARGDGDRAQRGVACPSAHPALWTDAHAGIAATESGVGAAPVTTITAPSAARAACDGALDDGAAVARGEQLVAARRRTAMPPPAASTTASTLVTALDVRPDRVRAQDA